MLEGPIRFVSVTASLVVLLSFIAFGIDQARTGSESSQAGIARKNLVVTDDAAGYANPSPAIERQREQQHSAAREVLDDADDVLIAPFASVTDQSKSAWARRTAPMLLALLVYGFGLGYLARFASGRSHRLAVGRAAHRA